MHFNLVKNCLTDYSKDNPLLVYDWNVAQPDWRAAPLDCDCWFRGAHSKCCPVVLASDKTEKINCRLPSLSDDDIDRMSSIFPPGILTIDGRDVSTGCKVSSYRVPDECFSMSCTNAGHVEGVWLDIFYYPGLTEHSEQLNVNVHIGVLKGPLSLEALFLRFGRGYKVFSVTFLGALSITVGFCVDELAYVAPRVHMSPTVSSIDYVYHFKGVYYSFKSYDKYDYVSPSYFSEFASIIGLVVDAIVEGNPSSMIRFTLNGIVMSLYVPASFVSQVYLFNFIRVVCLSSERSFKVGGSEATSTFHAMELMSCSDKPGMFCTPGLAYEQFSRLTGISLDDERFYRFSDYLDAYSNPVHVKADLKYDLFDHRLVRCAVCQYNKRTKRVVHDVSESRMVRRFVGKLGSITSKLDHVEDSDVVVFTSKESYGVKFSVVLSAKVFSSVIMSSVGAAGCQGRVCSCFYGLVEDDHVCTCNTMKRGQRYNIVMRDGYAQVVHGDFVVTRIYSSCCSDYSLYGCLRMVALYTDRVTYSEPFEATFSNNLNRILRDGQLKQFVSGDVTLVELLLSTMKSFLATDGLSGDIVDAIALLLRDVVIPIDNYVDVTRQVLLGLITFAIYTYNYMNFVGVAYTGDLYSHFIPVVAAMINGSECKAINSLLKQVCGVVGCMPFDMALFVSWIKEPWKKEVIWHATQLQ
jgi:hypothetical protein